MGDAAGSSISQQEVAALLRKEQSNTYGIMAPLGPKGERHIRGAGVYVRASLVNHECLPNVARFDSFDSQQQGSTCIELRALHDLPPGELRCAGWAAATGCLLVVVAAAECGDHTQG